MPPASGDMNVIEPGTMSPLELAAERSELAAKYRSSSNHNRTGGREDTGNNEEEDDLHIRNSNEESVMDGTEYGDDVEQEEDSRARPGTLLEAAFVDPSFSWPPADGQGKNAIELQASLDLVHSGDDDTDSVRTTESLRQRMRLPPALPSSSSTTTKKRSGFFCCGNNNNAVATPEELRAHKERTLEAKAARASHAKTKAGRRQAKARQAQASQKYSTVPDGLLIYRLDTTAHTLTLVSEGHVESPKLLTHCTVASARAAPDKNRRSLVVTATDGTEYVLQACEQRTATAWLEAMQLVQAKKKNGGGLLARTRSRWSHEKHSDAQLDQIEDRYMNLAKYSHKLIRAGAVGGKKGSGGAGGIYYSMDKVVGDTSDIDPETLEAVAKRRAVIKDSWDFYRMICSLLRDRNKYEEVFRKLQLDPVYPYLNSMTGLNDPGDSDGGGGYENLDKPVIQQDLPEYDDMTKLEVAESLVQQAKAAMPSLVEICKALAGSLGMEEVGVGPVKDAGAAIRKAEKKYGGDLLKVTDYCRALLVVRDLPSLLALLELARDSFGPLITRVKMSSLKTDTKAKPGGYRDCIINVELKGHVCEIQIHLWPMWVICGVDGFRHFRHCVEYNTDSFEDPYDALDGLDRKTMAELIVMAEEAVAERPLDNLEWYDEKFILDYFAEAGLFMKHGLDVWAEITFRHLIKLRTESPDIGPNHHETIILYKYLAQALRAQNRGKEAKEVMKRVEEAEEAKSDEKLEAEKGVMDAFGDMYDMVVDPSRKEREEEQKFRSEVKQSKKQWRRIRAKRFPFLDVDANEEKKVDDPMA